MRAELEWMQTAHMEWTEMATYGMRILCRPQGYRLHRAMHPCGTPQKPYVVMVKKESPGSDWECVGCWPDGVTAIMQAVRHYERFNNTSLSTP